MPLCSICSINTCSLLVSGIEEWINSIAGQYLYPSRVYHLSRSPLACPLGSQFRSCTEKLFLLCAGRKILRNLHDIPLSRLRTKLPFPLLSQINSICTYISLVFANCWVQRVNVVHSSPSLGDIVRLGLRALGPLKRVSLVQRPHFSFFRRDLILSWVWRSELEFFWLGHSQKHNGELIPGWGDTLEWPLWLAWADGGAGRRGPDWGTGSEQACEQCEGLGTCVKISGCPDS